MTSLRELQRAFCGAILSGDAAGVAALISSDGIPAAERVQIYRNNAQAAFLATLAATFPVIERLGGADWFRQSALQYQRRYPSRSGDLQFVGDRFEDFLRDRFAGTPYEYFCDVARLEWAYQEVLTAADGAALDPASLGAVAEQDYERMVFSLRPAVRLVESIYPIFAIWKVNQPGVATPGVATPGVATSTAAAAVETIVSLDAGPSRVLLIRRPDFVEVREIPFPTATLFNEFSRGTAFAGAAAIFAEAHVDAGLGDSLRDLLALGAIAGYRINQPEENKS
jgi:hypothetical protein